MSTSEGTQLATWLNDEIVGCEHCVWIWGNEKPRLCPRHRLWNRWNGRPSRSQTPKIERLLQQGLKQSEVARRVGVTKQRVHQVAKKMVMLRG